MEIVLGGVVVEFVAVASVEAQPLPRRLLRLTPYAVLLGDAPSLYYHYVRRRVAARNDRAERARATLLLCMHLRMHVRMHVLRHRVRLSPIPGYSLKMMEQVRAFSGPQSNRCTRLLQELRTRHQH